MWVCTKCCLSDNRNFGPDCCRCGGPVKFPGPMALKLSEPLVALLERDCEIVEVGGSCRRKSRYVRDLEIVVKPFFQELIGVQKSLFNDSPPALVSKLDNGLMNIVNRGVGLRKDPDRSLNGDRQKNVCLVNVFAPRRSVHRVAGSRLGRDFHDPHRSRGVCAFDR